MISRRERVGKVMTIVGAAMFALLPGMLAWIVINGYGNHPAAVTVANAIGGTAVAGILVMVIGITLWWGKSDG